MTRWGHTRCDQAREIGFDLVIDVVGMRVEPRVPAVGRGDSGSQVVAACEVGVPEFVAAVRKIDPGLADRYIEPVQFQRAEECHLDVQIVLMELVDHLRTPCGNLIGRDDFAQPLEFGRTTNGHSGHLAQPPGFHLVQVFADRQPAEFGRPVSIGRQDRAGQAADEQSKAQTTVSYRASHVKLPPSWQRRTKHHATAILARSSGRCRTRHDSTASSLPCGPIPASGSLYWLIAIGGLLVAAVLIVATVKPRGYVDKEDVLVTGEVSVDGKPLAAGKITFTQRDGQFVGGVVKNGRYSIDRVPAGDATVTIEGKGVAIQYTSQDTSWLGGRVVGDLPHVWDFELAGDDRGVPLPEDDPLLQAIEKRFGEPDYVTVDGRFLIQYRLPNGDTLTLVVSDDKVIGIEHHTLFD